MRRILVVDDEEKIRAIIRKYGEFEGYDITEAKDGMVTLTDETGGVANVTITDVVQSNGVIHVIDKVLLPKG